MLGKRAACSFWGDCKACELSGVLPDEMPSLGMLHPFDPRTVYLVTGSNLVAVNLVTQETTGWSPLVKNLDQDRYTELCCWVLPPYPTLLGSSSGN